MANSVDPDQTSRSAASDLGLHCFLMPVFPKTYIKYDNLINSSPAVIILDPSLCYITMSRHKA